MKFFFHRRAGSRLDAETGPSGPVSLGLTTLIELFEGDRASIVSLLKAALASIDANAADIESAAAARDASAVIEAAHRLKGTSSSIGAVQLIEIGSRIEAGARLTPTAISAEMLDELRSGVGRVTSDIAAYTLGTE